MADEKPKPHVHNMVLRKTIKEIKHEPGANLYSVTKKYWCDDCNQEMDSMFFSQGLKPPKGWNDGEEYEDRQAAGES